MNQARSAVFRLNNITVSYRNGGRRTQVLHNVNFHVRSHELTMIVGPSGSGKTTMLRVLGGLSAPDSGTVGTTEHRDLYAETDSNLSRYRNRTVGFIFQDSRLLSHYNAIENVMLPMKVAGLSAREQEARAARALEVVGLRGYKTRRVEQLSGGQGQRVGIARALAMRPRLLIADEPTGNLDRARSAEIMNLFLQLRTEHKISIVMVTHDRALATQADHLITIVGGRVREDIHATT